MGFPSSLPPRQPSLLIAAGLTALALLLPTANPTLDAWYYAACVRWRHDLLLPHHLLYNPLGVVWVSLLSLLPVSIDVRAALTAGNALLYGGILLALRPVLRAAGASENVAAAWLLVVGSTFGLLRFATENEAYLAPLLLSVLASEAWARWVVGRNAEPAAEPAAELAAGPTAKPAAGPTAEPRVDAAHQPWAKLRNPVGVRRAGSAGWVALAGSLAAGGCLLHQVHVWWWLALLLGTWWGRPLRWRAALIYAAPALLVPVAYGLAAHHEGFALTPRGLTDFIFHDYVVTGNTPTIGLKTLLLTGINLLRTLGQVHGTTLALLTRWPALALVPVAAGALGWQARRAWAGRRMDQRLGADDGQRRLLGAHGLAFGLHTGFAAVNDGNAEFMVMLPVLGAVLAVGWARWRPRPLALAGAALLLWNLAFGLLPNRFLTLNASAALAARVRAAPAAHWLLTDQHLTENRLTYQTGQFVWPQLHPSPTPLVRRTNGDTATFRRWLTHELAAGRAVYTDALSPPPPFDRARLAQENHDAKLLRGFRVLTRDTLPTAFAPVVLTRLGLPDSARVNP